MWDSEEMLEKDVPWLNGHNTYGDIAIASRIRLARNVEGYPFPHHASGNKLEEVVMKMRDVVENTDVIPESEFWPLYGISPHNRQLLLERRLISPEFSQKSDHGAVILDAQGRTSVMINGEDHIRMQSVDAGMNLENSWEKVREIDHGLNDNIKYAFSDDFGYLTSCPENIGTGLRVSVLMHLPALEIEDKLESVFDEINSYELMVRGFYFENDIIGNIYQISNKLTIGHTESDLLSDFLKIAYEIVDKEQEARNNLLETRSIEVEDRIYRSLGILERARKLSSREFIEHYSNLMLGTAIGMLLNIDPQVLHRLILWIQPAHLRSQYGEELTMDEEDMRRAEMVRTWLKMLR